MQKFMSVICYFIPFKKLRKKFRALYVKANRIKYRHNNKIIIHLPNGKTITNPHRIPELKVHFNGKNSTIELFYPIKFKTCEFHLINDCVITIHKSCLNYTKIEAYNESVVFIDENTAIGGVRVHMLNEKGTSLKIGKDVVLSYDIEIYTTDTHPIFDMNGKCINNKKSCVSIGNHCWIGASCVLLKGANIPENCILGHSSVCASKLSQPNSIYAGNPCKIVKSDITWHGGIID